LLLSHLWHQHNSFPISHGRFLPVLRCPVPLFSPDASAAGRTVLPEFSEESAKKDAPDVPLPKQMSGRKSLPKKFSKQR
jgi:hypothetical protein